MTQTSFVQIPFELINYVRSLKLSGTQYDLWLYLYSRDPYGDRFVEIPSPAEIAVELGVNPRTIQRAAQRLQDADLFDFAIDKWKAKNTTSNGKGKNFASDKMIQKRTKRSRCGQNDPVDDKTIQLSAIKQNDPIVESKPLSDKDSTEPQTIQIIQTSQTVGGIKNKCIENSEEERGDFGKLSAVLEEMVIDQNLSVESGKEEEISRQVIPDSVRVKLQELGIALDERVSKMIEDHDISQVWGAIRHIEETWETIDNPRGVFLYRVPRQEKEKSLKNPLNREFLQWYERAIIEGLVRARPPEYLPLDQFREPKVFLPDGQLIGWRKVAAGEYDTAASPQQMAEFFEILRGCYGTSQK
ncbi:MAG: hypothetical protein ACKO2T_02890 [Microcystis aeruginosa]